MEIFRTHACLAKGTENPGARGAKYVCTHSCLLYPVLLAALHCSSRQTAAYQDCPARGRYSPAFKYQLVCNVLKRMRDSEG
jgi:hypothetical protein